MKELKKADITIKMAPKYVEYECQHCGYEVEVIGNIFDNPELLEVCRC